MASKLSKEAREKKEKRIRDLEQENAELGADVALIEQERDAETENAALLTQLDELEGD